MAFRFERNENRVLQKYIPEPGETVINIPKGTEVIGFCSFEKCLGITEVYIPEGVKSISRFAFKGCKNLVRVCLPRSIEEIQEGAFAGTPWLKNLPGDMAAAGTVLMKYRGKGGDITVPPGITYIYGKAFKDNTEILSVKLPTGLRRIDERAFEGCRSLRSIELPEGLEYLGPRAFEECSSLERVRIPRTLKVINPMAFLNCCSLGSIDIPEGVEEISTAAFCGCSSLERIHLPDSIVQINGGAFQNCSSLKECDLPPKLIRIHDTLFRGCVSLERVSFGDMLFSVGHAAFMDCKSLKSVHLPESVKLSCMGRDVFIGCDSLGELTLEGGFTVKLDPHKHKNGCETYLQAYKMLYGAETVGFLSRSIYEELNGAAEGPDFGILSTLAMKCYREYDPRYHGLMNLISRHAEGMLGYFAEKSVNAEGEELKDCAESADIALSVGISSALPGFLERLDGIRENEFGDRKAAGAKMLDKYIVKGRNGTVKELLGIHCGSCFDTLFELKHIEGLAALLEYGSLSRERLESAIRRSIDDEDHEIYVMLVKSYNERFDSLPPDRRFRL